MPQVLKYNPKQLSGYSMTVFNPSGHGVAEFQTAAGLSFDGRRLACQFLADQLQDGYTVTVYDTIFSVGRSSARSRRIVWGGE